MQWFHRSRCKPQHRCTRTLIRRQLCLAAVGTLAVIVLSTQLGLVLSPGVGLSLSLRRNTCITIDSLMLEQPSSPLPLPRSKNLSAVSPSSLLFTDQGGCDRSADQYDLQGLFWASKKVNGFHEAEKDKIAVTFHRIPQFDHGSSKGVVATLRDAFLSGSSSIAFDCTTTYFAGGCVEDDPIFPAERLSNFDCAVDIGEAVVISQYWGFGYYHWLIEDFLRLAFVYDFLVANPHVNILSYSMPNAKFFYETIGISPSRVVEFKEDILYYGKRLLFPTASECGVAQGPALSFIKSLLRQRLLEKYPELGAKTGIQIVVQDRGWRQPRSLTNHVALVVALKAEFPQAEVIVFHPYDDFWETAKKHFSADLIIGPHGAGLSNVIFSQNSAMIEIHPHLGNGDYSRHKINTCHQKTAELGGSMHIPIIADNGDFRNPFTAPIDQILSTAHQLLDPLFASPASQT